MEGEQSKVPDYLGQAAKIDDSDAFSCESGAM